MYSRTEPTMVLADVASALDMKKDRTLVHGSSVHVSRDSNSIDIGGTEVPLTKHGITALGDFVNVPSAFLHRIGTDHPDLQEQVLHTLFANVDEVAVTHDDGGILDVLEPEKKIIDTRLLVDKVMDVVTADAPVYDWWRNTKEFRLDTIVPKGFKKGKGEGGEKKVGDITRGGVRVHVDLKNRLAPTVQPYLVRLTCLNGMECVDPSLSMDARGATFEEVLDAFGALCERAFGQVEDRIAQFYDLRNQKVENAERTVLRIAQEQGIADRFLVDIQNRAASDDLPDDPSMFDIVNLFTNEALNESIRNKSITRRNLEIAGGNIVVEHAARCGHCQSRLS